MTNQIERLTIALREKIKTLEQRMTQAESNTNTEISSLYQNLNRAEGEFGSAREKVELMQSEMQQFQYRYGDPILQNQSDMQTKIEQLEQNTSPAQTAANAISQLATAIQNAQVSGASVPSMDIYTVEVDTAGQPSGSSYTYHVNMPTAWNGRQGVFMIYKSTDGTSYPQSSFVLRSHQFGSRLSFTNSPASPARKFLVICVSHAEGLQAVRPNKQQGYPNQ